MVKDSRLDVNFTSLPAVIITNFAIDKKFRGRGLGDAALLWLRGYARQKTVDISIRYVILYAREAIKFYERNS
jgi:ribosomal protein S18 acetylase RimI-like enzyme